MIVRLLRSQTQTRTYPAAVRNRSQRFALTLAFPVPIAFMQVLWSTSVALVTYTTCHLNALGVAPAYLASNFVLLSWKLFVLASLLGMSDYCVKNAVHWVLRRMALVRTNFSEELIVSIIRVERIRELWTTLAVTSNWSKLGSVCLCACF
jgi:hypothetical protein